MRQLRLEHVVEQVKQRGGRYGLEGAQACAQTQALGALVTVVRSHGGDELRLRWGGKLEDGNRGGEQGGRSRSSQRSRRAAQEPRGGNEARVEVEDGIDGVVLRLVCSRPLVEVTSVRRRSRWTL